MSKNNTNKGITLIALVITIIVMLILVAVTISMAVNGGLFDYAGKAVGDTQNKIDEEQALASGGINVDGVWYESIDDYLADSKKDSSPGTLETIGTDTYQINSIEDLVALAYSVNSGETTYLGKTIELGKNLDFQSDSSYANPQAKYILESASVGYKPDETGTGIKELLLGDNGFIPVGISFSTAFYGTINGNDRVIKNMKITTVSSAGGLIGYSGTVSVSNLGMEKTNIETNGPAGGIVGQAKGGDTVTIDNCFNTGTIISKSALAGGMLGAGSGTISNCYNTGNIEGGALSGGIVCNGSIITITNCYNTGIITSTYGPASGIVADWSSGTIINCYNTGGIKSNSSVAGGIGGSATDGNITNCYNTGAVATEGSNAPAGGIIGSQNTSSGTITNCYNTGTVTSGNDALIGGVIGSNSGTITNCYFMKGSASVGIGNSGTGEATEKEESAMQTDTFLAELKGTTDNTAWKRDDLKNNKMPILSWQ